jgi:acyl-CoA oxidase
MDAEAAEFLSSGYLQPKQAELLRGKVHHLLAELRPQAVPLVDAWGVPDYQLNSALGRYDGSSPSLPLTPLILTMYACR